MNQVTTRPSGKPIDIVRTQLNLPSMREQLQMALPPHVDLNKFLRVAITALQQNPNLLELERTSLFASIVTAAQLGLMPDAQLGEAYFMPFKGKVQLVPGYRGLIKLARQGDIGHVEAEVICVNDRVEYVLGDESRFTAEVSWQNRGEMVAVYAVAKYRDGSIAARTVMSKEEVDEIRAKSPNANGPAWKDHYEEMAKKTAVRRLAKYMPLTTDAQQAFRVSELTEERGRSSQVIEGEVVADPEQVPSAITPPPEKRPQAIDALVPTKPAKPERRAEQASGPARKDGVHATPPVGGGDQRPASTSASLRDAVFGPKDDDGHLNVDPDTGEVLDNRYGPPDEGP